MANIGTFMSIYDYNGTFKLIVNKNLFIPDDCSIQKAIKTRKDNKDKSICKLDNSICRAKCVIFEYASCNNWDYFVTLTIDSSKQDRFNLDDFIKKFGTFRKNHYLNKGIKINYLFIPEKHKSGAWHLHGLIAGLPTGELLQFNDDMVLPYHILKRVRDGIKCYSWVKYSNKFGFSYFEEVQNLEAVSKYITKYISKDVANSVQTVGKHLYYCSRGLNRRKLVCTASSFLDNNIIWDFENDYVQIKNFSSEQLDSIINKLYNPDFTNSEI